MRSSRLNPLLQHSVSRVELQSSPSVAAAAVAVGAAVVLLLTALAVITGRRNMNILQDQF